MGHNRHMRRFVVFFWIVTIFASNLAWAVDIDGIALPDDVTLQAVADDGGAPAPQHASSDHCNHCCHGSAHLTGLVCLAGGNIPPLSYPLPNHALDVPLSSERVPPTPPPNI